MPSYDCNVVIVTHNILRREKELSHTFKVSSSFFLLCSCNALRHLSDDIKKVHRQKFPTSQYDAADSHEVFPAHQAACICTVHAPCMLTGKCMRIIIITNALIMMSILHDIMCDHPALHSESFILSLSTSFKAYANIWAY